jgi:phosphoribosyl 1,2-cyclic phosphodiesterase
MADQGEFAVRYWGVTGSFANPLPPQSIEQKLVESILKLCDDAEFRRRVARREIEAAWLTGHLAQRVPLAWRSTFGGNTTCLEIETPEALLIIDAGSGFRRLGDQLARRWNSPTYQGERTAHVLLTHSHMDHTLAIPFFDPFYDARNHFTVWGTRRVLQSLDAVLSPASSLRQLYFPPTYESLEGIKEFREIQPGDEFSVGEVHVRSFALNHPGESLAFRLDGASSSIVIASDHEQTAVPDWTLAEFAHAADLLYLDAQYLRAEYDGEVGIADEPPAQRAGWGHSHMEGAIETAVAAQVRRLHLGHHDPKRDDVQLAAMEQAARQRARDLLTAAGRAADSMSVQLAREGPQFHV